MPITLDANAVVAKPDETVSLAALFSVTAAASNPTYLIVSGIDRDEYTAGYSTAGMGTLSGNGATQHFQSAGSDVWSVGVVFTYQAATGQYYNPTYGDFSALTFTASAETNDNVSLSVFTTSNASLANADATNPYALTENPASFAYVGSVAVVTQPAAPAAPSQATPDSVCAAAESFVGAAWNDEGCWVLASNIAAEAGASLPLRSTLVGIAGVPNGEWIVAYNGPVSASSTWEQQVTAGEIVVFQTASGGGHITTVVSGSGTSAMLVDNITYVNSSGEIANPANDGSPYDIIVAAPHPATQEFNGVNPSMVVVYELDTPAVHDAVASVSIGVDASEPLAALFTATNPLAAQAITEWQVYNTNAADCIAVGGLADGAAHSAATAATVSTLSSVALLAGTAAGTDSIDVRAFNGSYWGDWQSLAATISTAAPSPPAVTDQTANQTWQQGERGSFTLPAHTFTDPQVEPLSYAASLASGVALPSWLTFNAATETFTGTVPTGVESLTIKVTATDTSQLSGAETFAVTVPAVAPVLVHPTATQTWDGGTPFALVLPPDTFTDPQGEALSYAATQADGQALPSWLSFNPADETFSGTAPATAQSLAIKVTATDTSGLSAADGFTADVTAAPSNVPPSAKPAITVTTPTPAQSWADGQAVDLVLPSNTFTDALGLKMSFAAFEVSGPNVAPWLHFTAASDTFSGSVPPNMTGEIELAVVATDPMHATAIDEFAVHFPGGSTHAIFAGLASTGSADQSFSFVTLPTN